MLFKYLIIVLFFLTAFDKIKNWSDHQVSIEAYELFNIKWVKLALFIFTSTEIYISFSFLLLDPQLISTTLCILLLSIYTGAVTINLRKGYKYISCGCGSVLESNKLSWEIVIRNFFLITISVYLFASNFLILETYTIIQNISSLLLALGCIFVYGIFKVIIKDLKLLNVILTKFI